MSTNSGIITKTNRNGDFTKITIDLIKHPEAKLPLTNLGYFSKSDKEIEKEEFYKEWNEPTNVSIEVAFGKLDKKIDLWDWKK